MKKLIALCVIGVLSIFSVTLIADQGAKQSTKDADADNTLTFFVALQNCIPGDYKEKNILADRVGSAWLQQTINGFDKGGLCSATLATPDGRQLSCLFAMDDLQATQDQHFMVGIVNNKFNDPSKDSIYADQVWTDLKSDSCSF